MKKLFAIVAALGMTSSTVLAEPIQPMRPIELSDNAMDRVTAGQSALEMLSAVVSALQVLSAIPSGPIPPEGRLVRLDGKSILLCGTNACAAAAGTHNVVIVKNGAAIAAASAP